MSRSFIDSAMGGHIVPQCYSSCVPAITSRQNPIVARFRAVANGDHQDRLLLDGPHLVGEALAAGLRVHEAATDGRNDRADLMALVDELRRREVPVRTTSTAVIQALSPVRSASPIVAIADRPAAGEETIYRPPALVLIAIDVQDPGNVGAIVRVAEAAGAGGVVCAGTCANPFGWKALRGSMGSALRLPIAVLADSAAAIADARRHGCRIVATVPRDGRPLFECDLRGPLAVLIGGEGSGLSPRLFASADERVTIPMRPPVESLNTAVSAALIIYEARRQRGP
jgi:TrmH family RNA methyltransferase